MSEKIQINGGVGLPSLVFIVFLILKLVGTIDWSWWWITAPLWIPIVIVIIIVIIVLIVAIFVAMIDVIIK